jgi:membrane-associated protein
LPQEWLLGLVYDYGYFAFYFALWLGIVGMPIPDEVIVITAGVVASLGFLRPIPAFIMTYLGVASGLSIGYVLGYLLGPPILERLARKDRLKPHIARAAEILTRYGSTALVVSYVFPVVRHIVPYLVGVNKLPFRRYALYSYSAGFAWTAIYFSVGLLVGENAMGIWGVVSRFSGYLFALLISVGILYWFVRRHRVARTLHRQADQ